VRRGPDSWDADLPLNERGEIDWREHATWTPAQRAAAHAEDDARMVCEASGHWLDETLANMNLADDDQDMPEEHRAYRTPRAAAAAA
jgi:hypothetical protein